MLIYIFVLGKTGTLRLEQNGRCFVCFVDDKTGLKSNPIITHDTLSYAITYQDTINNNLIEILYGTLASVCFFNILNPRQITMILILLYKNCISIQIAVIKLLGIIQDKYCKTAFDKTDVSDLRRMDLIRYC